MQAGIRDLDAPNDLIPSQQQQRDERCAPTVQRVPGWRHACRPAPLIIRISPLSRVAGPFLALLLSLTSLSVASAADNPPDAWITTKVKMSLLTSDVVSGTAVNVDTVEGVVTLHGTVGTAQEKSAAEKAARATSGVKEVRNLLAVVPKAQQAAVEASDDEIRKRVDAALDADARLDGSSIDVASVNKGVVVLSGKAESLSDHLRAIETARAVPGVQRVASEIQSPNQLSDAEIWRDTEGAASGAVDSAKASMSDMWITSAAKVRLMSHSATPASTINVDTTDGVVTLFGMVATSEAKKAAEAEVAGVGGVRQVKNELQVVPEKMQKAAEEKDEAVEERVSKKLEQAMRDDDVDVDVVKGVARLTGKVPSQVERLRVLTLVRSTAGVSSVVDELQIANK